MKKILLCLIAAISAPISSIAQSVPIAMTYQGRLTNATGAPVPDGNGYEIEVRLWDASTGGILLWGTRYTGIPLRAGAFNLILGSGGSSIPGATNTDVKAAFNTPTVYLGLTTTKLATGAAIASPTEILPRQQIFSVPFAMRSDKAINADHATQADTAQNAVIAEKANHSLTADVAKRLEVSKIPTTRTFTTSGIWNKPTDCRYIKVIVTGGGQQSVAGGTSSFGSHCSAEGGTSRTALATGGDINIPGGDSSGVFGGKGSSFWGSGKAFGGAGATDGGSFSGATAIKTINVEGITSEVVTVGAAGGPAAGAGVIVVEEFY